MMGRFYEDHAIGQSYDLGSYAFTPENIRRFSMRFMPVPLHFVSDAAADGRPDAVTAAGFHICCAWMSCFLQTLDRHSAAKREAGEVLPEIGPGAGLKDIRWPRPVLAGDVVGYRVEVAAMRELASKPTWGLLTVLAEGHNQHEELVMSFLSSMLTARRVV